MILATCGRRGCRACCTGRGAGRSRREIPDEYSRISDMEQVAKVLALTALDVCSLPK